MNFDEATKFYDSIMASSRSIMQNGELDVKFLLTISIMLLWSMVPLFKSYDFVLKHIDRRRSSRKEFISSISSLFSMLEKHPDFLVKKEFERVFNYKASVEEIRVILTAKDPLKLVWLIKHNPNGCVSFRDNGFLYRSTNVALDRNIAINNLTEWKNNSMFSLFLNLCVPMIVTGQADFFYSTISINVTAGLIFTTAALCCATINSLNYIKGISHIIDLFVIGDIKYMNPEGLCVTSEDDRMLGTDLKLEDRSFYVSGMIVVVLSSLFNFYFIYLGISLLVVAMFLTVLAIVKRSKFLARCLVLVAPAGVVMTIIGTLF